MAYRRRADAVAAAHPDFVCPISHALMRDAVVAADGHSYERREIERWFHEAGGRAQSGSGRVRSPLTGAAMTSAALIPNHSFRKAIESALEAAEEEEEEEEDAAAEEAAEEEAEEAEEAVTAEDAAAEAASSSDGGSGGGSGGGTRGAGGGVWAAESREEAAALRELAARAGPGRNCSKRPEVTSTHLPTLVSRVKRLLPDV